MSKRLWIILLALLVLVTIGATSSVDADPSCVDYSITAPVAGTRFGRHCVPLPSAFDFPVSFHHCQGAPPAGVIVCGGFDLNLLLP